jgi:ribosome-binding factor A
MSAFARAARVSRHIRNTLATVLQHQIQDPRLQRATITGVDLSPDLRQAKVYFSTTGSPAEIDKVKAGFQKAKPFIKRILAAKLGLRYMPDIRFCYDETLDQGERIEALLRAVCGENGDAHRSSDT